MASTSDGSTSFIERDRTASNGKCASCGGTTRAQDRIRCTLCHRYTHRDCLHADYKYTDNIIKNLAKPTVHGQPFAFVCAVCIPKVSIKDSPLIEQLADNRKESKVKLNTKVQELKSKLDNATASIQEKDKIIQDHQRRVQLLTEAQSSADVNALVSKFNEQLAESTSMIAN